MNFFGTSINLQQSLLLLVFTAAVIQFVFLALLDFNFAMVIFFP